MAEKSFDFNEVVENFKSVVTNKYFCFDGRMGKREYWMYPDPRRHRPSSPRHRQDRLAEHPLDHLPAHRTDRAHRPLHQGRRSRRQRLRRRTRCSGCSRRISIGTHSSRSIRVCLSRQARIFSFRHGVSRLHFPLPRVYYPKKRLFRHANAQRSTSMKGLPP